MFEPDANAEQPPRPWRDIAEEISHEFDPERLNELTEELSRALKKEEDQERRGHERGERGQL